VLVRLAPSLYGPPVGLSPSCRGERCHSANFAYQFERPPRRAHAASPASHRAYVHKPGNED
jgi:hypothetical protein